MGHFSFSRLRIIKLSEVPRTRIKLNSGPFHANTSSETELKYCVHTVFFISFSPVHMGSLVGCKRSTGSKCSVSTIWDAPKGPRRFGCRRKSSDLSRYVSLDSGLYQFCFQWKSQEIWGIRRISDAGSKFVAILIV